MFSKLLVRCFTDKSSLIKLAKDTQIRNFKIMMPNKSDVKFRDKHEWIKVDGSRGTVGITDYAQVCSNILKYCVIK